MYIFVFLLFLFVCWCVCAFTTSGVVCGKLIKNTTISIASRYEIEKFSGKNGFRFWRIKMRAMLVQCRIAEALKGAKGLPATMSQEMNDEILEKAHSLLIPSLADKVL